MKLGVWKNRVYINDYNRKDTKIFIEFKNEFKAEFAQKGERMMSKLFTKGAENIEAEVRQILGESIYDCEFVITEIANAFGIKTGSDGLFFRTPNGKIYNATFKAIN